VPPPPPLKVYRVSGNINNIFIIISNGPIAHLLDCGCDRTPWIGDLLVARPVPTHMTAQNKRTHTTVPRMGFEPKTPELERVKAFHVFEGDTTETGKRKCGSRKGTSLCSSLSSTLRRRMGEWRHSSATFDRNIRWTGQLHAQAALPSKKGLHVKIV
jgi:hypothetical protein